MLLDGGAAPLGVLSVKSGKVTPLPYDAKSDAERRMLAQVRGQERTYGDAAVYVKTESEAGPVARRSNGPTCTSVAAARRRRTSARATA